jgi:predicted transcriptional regulator
VAKTPKSFKLSDATLRQLHWLAEHRYNGNRTQAVEISIDRMYTEEVRQEAADASVTADRADRGEHPPRGA